MPIRYEPEANAEFVLGGSPPRHLLGPHRLFSLCVCVCVCKYLLTYLLTYTTTTSVSCSRHTHNTCTCGTHQVDPNLRTGSPHRTASTQQHQHPFVWTFLLLLLYIRAPRAASMAKLIIIIITRLFCFRVRILYRDHCCIKKKKEEQAHRRKYTTYKCDNFFHAASQHQWGERKL